MSEMYDWDRINIDLADFRRELADARAERNQAIKVARESQAELFKYRDANDGVYMEALKAERDAYAKDAERYRWIVNEYTDEVLMILHPEWGQLHPSKHYLGETIDAAIDARKP